MCFRKFVAVEYIVINVGRNTEIQITMNAAVEAVITAKDVASIYEVPVSYYGPVDKACGEGLMPGAVAALRAQGDRRRFAR